MAEHIAQNMHAVSLGDEASPVRNITVIQAGTGVGKSAAYLSTLVTLALARKTRLLVSTATVALQEQLIQKDLPALAKALPEPFVFALAKGRGRYVCQFKLGRFASAGANAALEELWIEEDSALTTEQKLRPEFAQNPDQRRIKLYQNLTLALQTGVWNGDRDTLELQPEPGDWSGVAADRHTCTTRHCPNFRGCSYFRARTLLTDAQVIVVNHDLVLASLGTKSLPELDKCLLVFDEGHHLPAVALEQFSSSMDLSSASWLDKLARAMQEVAERISVTLTQDIHSVSGALRHALQDLARMAADLLQAGGFEHESTHRFDHGVLPDDWAEPLRCVQGLAVLLSQSFEALGLELKQRIKEEPLMAATLSGLYARLGQFAPRLHGLVHTSKELIDSRVPPCAKWLRSSTAGAQVYFSAHACPLESGALLGQHVWSQVRGAVITSASLSSCGNFDFFLHESGLNELAHVHPCQVESPFDFAQQGELIVVETRVDPKLLQAYTQEMLVYLLADLHTVQQGALVLFTSRVQMRAVVAALPATLQDRVLVQGAMSRSRLLTFHAERVQTGLPSIIFGMQSFGEGLDLPGNLCNTVLITKLPFASPAEPVQQARAEWMKPRKMVPSTRKISTSGGMSTNVTCSARRDSNPILSTRFTMARPSARNDATVMDMIRISSPAAGISRPIHGLTMPSCTWDHAYPAAPQMAIRMPRERFL